MFQFNPRKKHQTITVRCGGCGTSTPLHGARRIKVPTDQRGGCMVDARPKTPTGGKFGMPGSNNRRIGYTRMVTQWGCTSCQGIFTVVEER